MNAKNLNRLKVVLVEQGKTCKCLAEQWESLLDVPPGDVRTQCIQTYKQLTKYRNYWMWT